MKEIYKALANFQNEVPTIHEETKGYNYTYSNLNTIFKVIKPLLKKNDLAFTQLLNGKCLNTVLFHIESGESIESNVELPLDVQLKGQNQFQVNGSAITYYRRYSLAAMLGLITDKDIDAKGDVEKPVKTKPVFTKDNFPKALLAKASLSLIKNSYSVSKAVAEQYDKEFEQLNK